MPVGPDVTWKEITENRQKLDAEMRKLRQEQRNMKNEKRNPFVLNGGSGGSGNTLRCKIKYIEAEPNRPDWDEYFMGIAKLVAERSTCLRRKVGAILVVDNHILSTGYNGAPAGLPHCSEIGCIRSENNIPSGENHELCRGLHAEQNAIIQAALHGVSTRGATLYCTTFPCSICAKMLINAGIARVAYAGQYDDDLSADLFKEADIIFDWV